MSEKKATKRALISVSDKSGVEQLAQQLHQMGVEIISTGGTLKRLKEAGVPAISITTFTGEPEIMDGRVKTLHPKVYAGLLYRRDNPDDCRLLTEMDYRSIDLVVVNLYPFQQTVARADATDAEIIENIDIGGPSMIRASAKNFTSVTVVVDPSDYDELIVQLTENDGGTTAEFRKQCALKAFQMTSSYDTAIAGYFGSTETSDTEVFPQNVSADYSLVSTLRYGENPHQQAALYAKNGYSAPTLIKAEVHSGKELSFNNYNDLDAVLDMMFDFSEPFACVFKHCNPCGAAIGADIAEAYKLAYESDPLSAFGSIIGLNREVDMAAAELLRERLGSRAVVASPASSLRRAGYLAELGWQRLERGEVDDVAALAPIYLRHPAIE